MKFGAERITKKKKEQEQNGLTMSLLWQVAWLTNKYDLLLPPEITNGP